MSADSVYKFRSVLIEHHNSEVEQIHSNNKTQEAELYDIQLLILRYKLHCFAEQDQYQNDLREIRQLPRNQLLSPPLDIPCTHNDGNILFGAATSIQ